VIATIVRQFYRSGAKNNLLNGLKFTAVQFFMLFIYLVFIIALFGFMINWNNEKLMMINFKIFLFKDLFFNVNLLGFIVNECWLNYQQKNNNNYNPEIFSGRILVLHISIILGAFLFMTLKAHFPELFSGKNAWISLFAISPFLVVKLFVEKKLASKARYHIIENGAIQ